MSGSFSDGPEHLEVVADLLHRERDVLVRLHLDLLLEVGVARGSAASARLS